MPLALFVGLSLLSSCSGGDYALSGDTVTVKGKVATVRIQVVSPSIMHVSEVPGGKFSRRESLMIVPREGQFTDFSVSPSEDGGTVSVSTSSLRADIDRSTSLVSFYDGNGTLLSKGRSVSFSPTAVEGKKAYSVVTEFESPDDEAFYGLGQQQSGEFNHKGLNEELYQYNTKISVPFVLSSRNYGILFDAYSLSRWGNPAPYRQLGQVFKLYDKDGKEGALTATYTPRRGAPLVQREDSLYYENEREVARLPKMNLKGAKVLYEGYLEAPSDGEYFFIQYYAGFQRTLIDGKEVMSRRWRPAWNPNSYKYSVALKAGQRVPISVEWEPDGGVSYMGLRVAELRSPEEQSNLTFFSEFEPQIDYYYIAGDDMDDVISGYRQLTGKASLFPKWSLGFWQSRERYTTQDELVSTLAEFRRRGIPVDNIVQDWQYWKDDQWGSHEFDESRYPDPEKMLDDVHAMHARFMISVWPKFYTNTENYAELKNSGYVYTHPEDTAIVDWLGHKQSFYDAYSEGGRKMFWEQMDRNLYSRYGRKIDAWWMDASEPNLRDCLPMDYLKWLLTPTALGPSTEYLNAYALVNADAIYNGQRSVDPDKRVFLLTRNGFAGLQRYSTASWSGDIGTSWLDMRMQMAAGLNYSMAGLPMWGMDIGGFSVMDKYNAAMGEYLRSGKVTEDLKDWRELQTRWHQFGAFVPLFRTHGQWPAREIWNIDKEGTPTYNSILYYMKLRYRLMPYLYSLAAMVHFNDYTMMRGLPMDFPGDGAVRDLSDQWMLGPAFMPCPVYEYGERSRKVHFPGSDIWYDFYNGKCHMGGTDEVVDAPYERMPLYVRAGSIVPLGPDMVYSDEKKPQNIEILIFGGRDSSFTLYEDEGENYNYEKGAYATIPLTWDDSERTLTIGGREGSFPGMLEDRTFTVRLCTPTSPLPYTGVPAKGGKVISYSGEATTVKL